MNHKERCSWCIGDKLYETYHDKEWGIPTYDDTRLFEFLILELFQAGLSWITILRKRDNFRMAFENFDYYKISKYTDDNIQGLLQNKSIIRNKLKIKATISNAQAFIKIQKQFGSFSNYIWAFTKNTTIQNKNNKNTPSNSPLSYVISQDLKRHGFKFIGSTIIYAFMQSIGMVNDHEITCFRYKEHLKFK